METGISKEVKHEAFEGFFPEEKEGAAREFDPEIRERVKRLRLIDDTLFMVVAKDREAVQEILRTVMLDENLVVEEVQTQYELPNLRGRSVRLDAHCVLGDGRRCNIEVQKAGNDDHARRVRYNASCITASCTDTGTRFEEVPDVCVVYISTFDIFGLGKMCYEERSMLISDAVNRRNERFGTIVDNGYRAIYVNTKIKDEKLPKLAKLMELFMQENLGDEYLREFPEITKEVNRYKNTEKGETEMCEIVQEYADKCAEKAKAEGKAEGETDAIKKFLKFGMGASDIAKALEKPLEEVERIAAELND